MALREVWAAGADKFNFIVQSQETVQGKAVYRLAPVHPVEILMEQTDGPAILVHGDALSCKVGQRSIGKIEMENGQKGDVMQATLSCEHGVKLAMRLVILH
jgi:hypothetical protein